MATVTDWIKMRTDLYRDPKVCLMADILLHADGPFLHTLRDHHVIDRDQSRDQSRDHGATRMMLRCVTRNAIVGALVSVWGVLRHRGDRVQDDLYLTNMSISVIDDIAELPGFGKAMVEAGWIRIEGGTVILPRFYAVFNSDPSTERKAKNAENNRKYRERMRDQSRDQDRDQRDQSRDHHAGSKRDPREEKRREEKEDSKTPPPPATGEGPKTDDATAPPVSPPPPPTKRKVASADPNFDPLAVDLPFKSDRFREAWEAWVRHRVKIKKRMSLDAVRLFFHQFVSWGEERTIAAIEHSIMQGYQGVFENTNRQGGAANGGRPFKTKLEQEQDYIMSQIESLTE